MFPAFQFPRRFADFLASAFGDKELRRLIVSLPDTTSIWLPGDTAPLAELCDAVVEMLRKQRRFQDPEVWAALDAERPHARVELGELRRAAGAPAWPAMPDLRNILEKLKLRDVTIPDGLAGEPAVLWLTAVAIGQGVHRLLGPICQACQEYGLAEATCNAVRRVVSADGPLTPADLPPVAVWLSRSPSEGRPDTLHVGVAAVDPRLMTTTQSTARLDTVDGAVTLAVGPSLSISVELSNASLTLCIKGSASSALSGAAIRIWSGARAMTKRLIPWIADINGPDTVTYFQATIALPEVESNVDALYSDPA